MADRLPLVFNAGEIEQIQSSDALTVEYRIGVGVSAPASLFEGEGTSGTTELRLTRVSADTGSPRIRYRKARGTPGSEADVASGDIIGVFTFNTYRNGAYQGSDTPASCMFFAEVTGTPAGDSVPGAVVFNVTDTGQTSSANAVRISEESGLFIYVSPANDTPTNIPTNAAGFFSKDSNAQIYSIEEDGTVWHVTGYGVLESDGMQHIPSTTTGARPAAGTAARICYNSTTGQLQLDNGTDWKANPLYVASKTASYTIVDENVILADCTSGAITLTLPAAADFIGQPIHCKKIDASGNSMTIDGAGAETIDDSTTAVTSIQYTTITVVSDGTEWWII